MGFGVLGVFGLAPWGSYFGLVLFSYRPTDHAGFTAHESLVFQVVAVVHETSYREEAKHGGAAKTTCGLS